MSSAEGQEQEQSRPRFKFPFERVHDPSTIVRDGAEYWLFHTGRGVSSLKSPDLRSWESGPSVFQSSPAWSEEAVPGHRGRFWAPDIIQIEDRFLLYYSVSTFGKNESVIALASNSTLDPDDPSYEWKDQGIVVETTTESDHNAIDPSLLLTSSGELWMAYGSFWSGIKLVQLDPQTGLRLANDSPIHSVAWKEQIEAPGLIEHDGYFYLFVDWGWCCRGIDSTYEIRIGRSRSITGPYLDRGGNDMLRGGGSLVLEASDHRIGPGHAEFLQVDSQWLLSYHYYDASFGGMPRLGLHEISWDESGWPVAGEVSH